VLIGGGYTSAAGSNDNVFTFQNFPSTPGAGGTWTVTLDESGPNFLANAYAICATP
jgi:hypothetical protein